MQGAEDETPRAGPRMPPAPIWRDRELNRLLGLEMLRELPEDGALGVALWRLLWYVEAWTRTPAGERVGRRLLSRTMPEVRELMRGARDEMPELAPALAAFARHLRDPGNGTGPKLAAACGLVAKWAENGALMETAAHFAEAAAFADPDGFRWHRNAGRLCRRLAHLSRAELWFRRAFHLAVRAGRRTDAVRALLGYGAVLKARGRHDEARTWIERAAKRAGWANRPKYQAEAHHDLAALEAEAGAFSVAIKHFREALRLYAPSSTRVLHLVHDAAFLLVMRGNHSQALPILNHLLPLLQRAEERALVWATVAIAAGGARRLARFQEAEDALLQLAPRYPEYAGAAFLALADGSRAFGRWTDAARYAAMAATIAEERADGAIGRKAAALADRAAP